MNSYEVRASHPRESMKHVVTGAIAARHPEHITLDGMNKWDSIVECNFDGDELMTDDFTPEQALTRMAYKVFGEII